MDSFHFSCFHLICCNHLGYLFPGT